MNSQSDGTEVDSSLTASNSTFSTILDLPPSCVEVSPIHPNLCVIGTYFLNATTEIDGSEDSQTGQPQRIESLRRGSLILFKLQGTGPEGTDANQRLSRQKTSAEYPHCSELPGPTPNVSEGLVQTISTPYATLDLHFSPHDPSIFAVATSTGAVVLFSLDPEHPTSITSLQSIQVADPEVLVLSLAWNPSPALPSTIAVSLSSGYIAIFDYKFPETTLKVVQAHSLEVWTVAWSTLTDGARSEILYSGGDDSALCRHTDSLRPPDLGGNEDSEDSEDRIYVPLSRDAKTHGAGVTAILPLPTQATLGGEILLTGSYDEFIRVLEPAASGRRSTVLAEKRLGGGVWRLKFCGAVYSGPEGETRLNVLASCMHAGAKILEICHSAQRAWMIRVVAKFEEHESMNYASDTSRQSGGDGVECLTFVSTSFYDKKLCIWNVKGS